MATSATTGVMNPLLGKLTTLLSEEYKKLTGVTKQARFLKDELSAIKALLDKMELMDKLDPTAKNWRDHVREMSYDMENCIDDFMHDIEGVHAKKGFVKKMARRLRRLGRRHQIANRIEELKILAVEANARRERYKIDDSINSSPGVVVVDPRMTAIYKEAAGLVGINCPREELASVLMDSKKKLKVVSIVGFGGLGKTTLAKQVYDEIGGQFSCTAFISVSQRPDVKSLLSGLHIKLGLGDCFLACELQDIIERLRVHLKHKRYFILVDDLWDDATWNIISCAFPENGNGSRVLVTTRLDDVAFKACPSDHVFGSENVCPPKFQEISAQILKKCGGLPLAIITIASLLASREARSLSQWESISNSLGAKFATNPTLEEMRGILNLSYMHLPIHLRPCFLYLGMYPEDREIERDDLVRQWVAEGFVCNLHEVDLDDVGKGYFNELINRSLIQPEETLGGEVLSCRVHDMMLDLILSKSTEDNFISVAYNYEDMARLHSSDYKVRRLSLQSSADGETSETLATSMSQVRSYAQFGESIYTPPLSQFKYLRVFVFEFPTLWKMKVDLTAIGHLFLLRYLKVEARQAMVVFPAEFQGLVHLETLDLICRSRQSFPSDLANLRKLELHIGFIQDMTVECLDAFVCSIETLRDLKYLSLGYESEFDVYFHGSQLDSLVDPPPRLEVLDLEYWYFLRVPKWIGELGCLQTLNLQVMHMSSDEVRVLGQLPSLVSAFFYVLDVSQEKVIIGTGLFLVLEYFRFNTNENVPAYLSFEEGAMPKLRTLVLEIGWNDWSGATPVGMECLPCLEDIHVWLRFSNTKPHKSWAVVQADVESAFNDAARVHPRHPSVTCIIVD
nr:NBS-LRR disease resistance protein [Dasypyrum villosum]